KPRLVAGVVHARATVQQNERRPLSHGGPGGHELRAFHIEVKPYTVHPHMHNGLLAAHRSAPVVAPSGPKAPALGRPPLTPHVLTLSAARPHAGTVRNRLTSFVGNARFRPALPTR